MVSFGIALAGEGLWVPRCNYYISEEVLVLHLAFVDPWGQKPSAFLLIADGSSDYTRRPLILFWLGGDKVPHYCSWHGFFCYLGRGWPHYSWAVVKVLTLIRPPLMPPAWGRIRTSHYCWGRSTSPVSLHGLPDSAGSLSGPLWHTTVGAKDRGLGCLVRTCPRWKSRLPTQHLLVWVGPQLFLWCLTEAEWLLSKSFLVCWAPLFLILWLDKAGFCWGFFLSVLLGFLSCWVFWL